MRYLSLYRAAAFFRHTGGQINSAGGVFAADAEKRRTALRMLRKHRTLGAALCLFDASGITGTLTFGTAGGGRDVLPGTFFRTASVSKMVTGALAAGLAASGALDEDRDVQEYLGVPFRAPDWPHVPVTAGMLLSHTASVRDGEVLFHPEYTLAEAAGRMAFTGKEPGKAFEYSNEGAALLGAVLEKAAGADLDRILSAEFGLEGTYFPCRLPKEKHLSDAVRILPTRRTMFSGRPEDRGAVPERDGTGGHWNRAHGGLCMRAEDLAEIARRLMTDERYRSMRREVIPMGERDPMITEGRGMFILRYPECGGRVLYGHQGLAYGAAHGVFFDPEAGRGAVILTSGCSLSREHVLTDLNRDVIGTFIAR